MSRAKTQRTKRCSNGTFDLYAQIGISSCSKAKRCETRTARKVNRNGALVVRLSEFMYGVFLRGRQQWPDDISNGMRNSNKCRKVDLICHISCWHEISESTPESTFWKPLLATKAHFNRSLCRHRSSINTSGYSTLYARVCLCMCACDKYSFSWWVIDDKCLSTFFLEKKLSKKQNRFGLPSSISSRIKIHDVCIVLEFRLFRGHIRISICSIWKSIHKHVSIEQ